MTRPSVLFACIHNSGRSVAAQVLAHHYAGDRADFRSAGSEPGAGVNPVVAAVLAERGFPAGKRYEDWQVDDPAGQDIDPVRRIVDDIDERVRRLVGELLG